MASKEKKAPWFLLRNSRGNKDAMWTLVAIAFFVTTFAYLASMINAIQVGSTVISFRAFDGLGYAAVVLVPLLGAYFGRRFTDSAHENSVAKAKIYAEVAKRKLETAQAVTVGETTVQIDQKKVAEQIHETAEAELKAELEEPQDEV